MFLTKTGFGINNTSPQYALDVAGTANFTAAVKLQNAPSFSGRTSELFNDAGFVTSTGPGINTTSGLFSTVLDTAGSQVGRPVSYFLVSSLNLSAMDTNQNYSSRFSSCYPYNSTIGSKGYYTVRLIGYLYCYPADTYTFYLIGGVTDSCKVFIGGQKVFDVPATTSVTQTATCVPSTTGSVPAATRAWVPIYIEISKGAAANTQNFDLQWSSALETSGGVTEIPSLSLWNSSNVAAPPETGGLTCFGTEIILGNLGINNVNPSYALDVTGSLRVTGNIVSGGVSSQIGNTSISPGTDGSEIDYSLYRNTGKTVATAGDQWNLGINTGGSGDRTFGLWTNSTGLVMRVDPAGNVTFPGGSFKATNGSTDIKVPSSTDGVYSAYIDNTNSSYSSGSARLGLVSSAGTVLQIGVHNTGVAFTWLPGASDYTVGTNNIERLRITATGSVGIGVSNPQYGLEVAGSSRVYSQVVGTTTPAGGAVVEIASGSGGIKLAPNQDGQHLQFKQNAIIDVGLGQTFVIRSTDWTNYLTFTERFRVDTTGYVGVGTGAPVTHLHVQDSSLNSGNIYLGNNGTLSYGLLKGTDGGLYFTRGTWNSGTVTMALSATGNVGIGTQTPSFGLDVNGTGRFVSSFQTDSYHLFNNGDSGDTPAGTTVRQMTYAQHNVVGNNHFVYSAHSNTPSNNHYQTWINTGSGGSGGAVVGFDVMASGTQSRLGVNMINPSYTLDVAGPSRSTVKYLTAGNASGIGTVNYSSSQIVMSQNGSYSHAFKTRHDATTLSNNTVDMFIWKVGVDSATTGPSQPVLSATGTPALGIANVSPQYTLDVGGSVRHTGSLTVNNISTGNFYQLVSPQQFAYTVSGNLTVNTLTAYTQIIPTGVNGRLVFTYSSATGFLGINNNGIKINGNACTGTTTGVVASFGATGGTDKFPAAGTITLDSVTGPTPALVFTNAPSGISGADGTLNITVTGFYWQASTQTASLTLVGTNVGVSQTNPAFTLDVGGSINIAGSIFKGGSPYIASQWTTSGTNISYTTGAVGINTSSPAYTLDTTGTIRVQSAGTVQTSVSQLIAAVGTWSVNVIGRVGLGNYNNLCSADDSLIYFTQGQSGTGGLVIAPWSSNSYGLRMTSTGFTGINTASPGYTLDVNGTIGRSSGGNTTYSCPNALSHIWQINQSSSNALLYNASGHYPATDNACSLGLSNFRWSNLYTNAANVTGSLNLSGGVLFTNSKIICSDVPAAGARAPTGYSVYDSQFAIEMCQPVSGTYGPAFITRNADGVFVWKKVGSSTDNGTTLMYLNNSGYLGIGNSAPSYNLDVSGTSRFTNTVYLNTSSNLGLLFDNGGYVSAKNSVGTSENFLWPRYVDNATYMNYGSAGMYIRNNSSTSTLYLNASNQVGIATTSPGYTLDVNGQIHASSHVSADATTNFTMLWNDGLLMCKTNNYLRFGWSDTVGTANNYAEKMRIHTNGFIGINNTNPAYVLDVGGSGRFSSGLLVSSTSVIEMGQGSTKESNAGKIGYGNFSTGSCLDIVGAGTTTSIRRIQFYDLVGVGMVPAYSLDIAGNGRFSSTVVVNNAAFSAALNVTPLSNSSPAVNGIYVLNPTNSAGNHASTCVRVGGSSAGNPFYSMDVSGVSGWSMGVDNADSQKFKIRSIWDFSANDRFAITTGGSVGIGNSSPSYTLDVSGTFRSTGTAIAGTAAIGDVGFGSPWGGFAATSAFNTASYAVLSNATTGQTLINANNSTYISFRLSNAEQGGWTSTGLGIGTASPAYRLDVSGAARVGNNGAVTTSGQNALYVNGGLCVLNGNNDGGRMISALDSSMTNSSARYITLGQANSTNNQAEIVYWHISAGSGSNRLGLGLYGGEKVSILAGGNVGIGQQAPSYLLDVNGTARVTTTLSLTNGSSKGLELNNGVYFNAFNSGGTSETFLWPRWTDNATYMNYGTGGCYIRNNGSTVAIFMNNSAQVGINNTSPSYSLDVSGTLRTTSSVLLGGTTTISGQTFINYNNGNGLKVTNAQSGNVESSIITQTNDNSWVFGNNCCGRFANQFTFGSSANGFVYAMSLTTNGNLQIAGALSKGSGTFQIPHPTKPDIDLLHSFIEGPRCDLIYRGRKQLVNGSATVDLDAECTGNGRGMTRGTFEALNRDCQVYLQNNDTWDMVKGVVSGATLVITCNNPASSAMVDWMVVGERQDATVRKWDKTDADGRLVLEHPTSTR